MTDVQDPYQPVGFRTWAAPKTAKPQTDPRPADEGIGLRQPIMNKEETRRLLVAVPNDTAGNNFLHDIWKEQHALGIRFAGTLGQILSTRGVKHATFADEMIDKFAFLDILPGFQFAVMSGILRHGCATKSPNDPFPNIDVEPDQRMRFRVTGLGPNFKLNTTGSKHDDYLKILNASASVEKGKDVVIAVVDSGVEKDKIVDGFLDLVEPSNTLEKDNFGHGTAMGTIIKDVARDAKVYAVRMSDQDPDVSEAMLGMSAGSFHYKADIVNLSSGLPEGTTCPNCGAQPGVSKVLKRFLQSLSEKAISSNGKPVLVAATGTSRAPGLIRQPAGILSLPSGRLQKPRTALTSATTERCFTIDTS